LSCGCRLSGSRPVCKIWLHLQIPVWRWRKRLTRASLLETCNCAASGLLIVRTTHTRLELKESPVNCWRLARDRHRFPMTRTVSHSHAESSDAVKPRQCLIAAKRVEARRWMAVASNSGSKSSLLIRSAQSWSPGRPECCLWEGASRFDGWTAMNSERACRACFPVDDPGGRVSEERCVDCRLS